MSSSMVAGLTAACDVEGKESCSTEAGMPSGQRSKPSLTVPCRLLKWLMMLRSLSLLTFEPTWTQEAWQLHSLYVRQTRLAAWPMQPVAAITLNDKCASHQSNTPGCSVVLPGLSSCTTGLELEVRQQQASDTKIRPEAQNPGMMLTDHALSGKVSQPLLQSLHDLL